MTDRDPEQKWERTPVPFIAAAGVVLVVIAYIVISSILSPAEDNVSDEENVRIAAHEFVDARAGDDAERKRDTVCTGFDEAAFAEKVGATGVLSIDDVADTSVDGDHATASITSELDGKDPRTTTWSFSRGSDGWVVC